MSYSPAPALPSSTRANSYTVRLNPSPPPLSPTDPTSSATVAFYASRSNTSLNRARSMSSASRVTTHSSRDPLRERSNSVRSAGGRTVQMSSPAPTEGLPNRINHPYSYPHASRSQSFIPPLPTTSLHSLHSSSPYLQHASSKTHTPNIHPHPSFFRPKNVGVTPPRSTTERNSQGRPPSIQLTPSAIQDSQNSSVSLGRRPSGRSVLSSRTKNMTTAAVVPPRKRVRDTNPGPLSGYQSDGYLSEGGRSNGYYSDGQRSQGYQSDGGRSRRGRDVMLPIGVVSPLAVGRKESDREKEQSGGNRRSWDTRWMDGVNSMGIGGGGYGYGHRIQGEEEKYIGMGMIIPGEESRYGEPLSPQEPARSQFLSDPSSGFSGSQTRSRPPTSRPQQDDDGGMPHSTSRPEKHPRFAPLPPAPTPPLNEDRFSFKPMQDRSQIPWSRSKPLPVKNYKLLASRNSFLCGGRLLMGGDAPWPFVVSVAAVLIIAAVWLAGVGAHCSSTWGERGWAVLAVGCWMIALVIASMLVTAFRDPGIIPRNLDLNPPSTTISNNGSMEEIPLPRDLRARSGVVRVKYCSTCKTYRPPRASHCKVCDNCVDGIDHHCTYLHNCVGRRNYTTFVTFLVSSTLTLVYVIVTSAVELWDITISQGSGFKGALQSEPLAAVSFALAIIVVWPVAALLLYHSRLQVLNVTTIEQIRAQTHRSILPGSIPPNPFNLGHWYSNMFYVLCRPAGYEWLQPSKRAEEDTRLVNPGWRDEEQDDGASADRQGPVSWGVAT